MSCGSETNGPRSATQDPTNGANGGIVVFAASSLTEAFTDIGGAFSEQNPGATVTFNFAGSSDLVAQIAQGAPADVFASADESNMTKLIEAGHAAGNPVPIAENTFAIIVETGNPQGVATVADLDNPELIVVLCSTAVPCGRGAETILANAGVTVNPKSLETNVKGVVTKVAAGEADAGIVFVTDVDAAGADAAGIALPADINAISAASMVLTDASRNPDAARDFVEFVAGPTGQSILASYGFMSP